MDLLKVFSMHGHSGFSAPYAIDIFKTLAKFEPLSPLTGDESEWVEVGENTWQNRRCSHVFKDKDHAYDINGKVFWEWYSSPDVDDGKPFKSYFTSSKSHVTIEFPYTPNTVYEEYKDEV